MKNNYPAGAYEDKDALWNQKDPEPIPFEKELDEALAKHRGEKNA